jgi:hypothetical protein
MTLCASVRTHTAVGLVIDNVARLTTLRWTRFRADYRSQKFSDVATAMIGRNREHGVDHVAIDVGSFLATGTRICRDLVGPERDA